MSALETHTCCRYAADSGFFSGALTPQQRAIDFLSREVPRWARENHCYSCHNNGDAARALYLARQRGYVVPPESMADTSAWLLQPAKWNEIHGNPAASDRKLARIQFASALTEGYRTGATRNLRVLAAAAESLLAYQDGNGSWVVEEPHHGRTAGCERQGGRAADAGGMREIFGFMLPQSARRRRHPDHTELSNAR